MDDAAREARASQAQIDELWDFDDPAASEGRFRTAAAEVSGSRRDALLMQVARALGLAGRYDDGLAVLDGLLDRALLIRAPLDRAPMATEIAARERLERGRIRRSRGEPDAARPLFEEAFALAMTAALDHLAVDALHMVAIVAPPEEQAELDRRAIELAGRSADPRARQWRASLLNNAAWTEFGESRYEAALAMFEEALAERTRQAKPREIGIARWSVARTLRALGRVEEALAAQRELRSANAAASVGDSYVDEEIGECLLELGRPAEAADAFAAAVQQAESGAPGEDDSPDRLARLRRLASGGPG